MILGTLKEVMFHRKCRGVTSEALELHAPCMIRRNETRMSCETRKSFEKNDCLLPASGGVICYGGGRYETFCRFFAAYGISLSKWTGIDQVDRAPVFYHGIFECPPLFDGCEYIVQSRVRSTNHN